MWSVLSKRIQLDKLNLTVILLYLLFTLIFTFPLFLHISTATPMADGQGDQFIYMWMFWWFKTALFSLKTSPLFTNFMYYPHGTSLIYHMPIFLSLLALPFQYLLGSPTNLIVSYNLLLMFTFVLSGFGVYLLTKYLIKDPVTAFICGLLFAFCSYRLWHLNHLNLLSTEWIPFYILYLIRSVDEKSLKNALWTGVFFIFTFLSEFTCALFLVIFTLIYWLYLLVKSRKRLFDKKIMKNSSLALIAVVIILSPFLYSLSTTQIDWQPQTKESISANLVGYFLPVKEMSLWGSSFLPSQYNYNGIAGGEIFLGYVLIFFVLYTWIKRGKERIKLWFFSSLAFFLLSLGHTIHLYNHSYYFNWLPYNILYTYIPLLQIGRTPCRFSLMVTLGLIIFSSYGLTRFLNLYHSQDKDFSDLKNFFRGFLNRKGMPLVVVVLIGLEFMIFPITLLKVEVPETYYQIKNTPGDFAILELPAVFRGYGWIGNVYMYYQTVHEKKTVNGYLSRHSSHSMDFLKEVLPKEQNKLDLEFKEKLADNDVKYYSTHEWFNRPKELMKYEDESCLIIKEKPSGIKLFHVF